MTSCTNAATTTSRSQRGRTASFAGPAGPQGSDARLKRTSDTRVRAGQKGQPPLLSRAFPRQHLVADSQPAKSSMLGQSGSEQQLHSTRDKIKSSIMGYPFKSRRQQSLRRGAGTCPFAASCIRRPEWWQSPLA